LAWACSGYPRGTDESQYIDISHLPYGNYCLTLIADPNRDFIEDNVFNNTSRTLISIRSGRVSVLAQSCG